MRMRSSASPGLICACWVSRGNAAQGSVSFVFDVGSCAAPGGVRTVVWKGARGSVAVAPDPSTAGSSPVVPLEGATLPGAAALIVPRDADDRGVSDPGA